MTASRHFTSSLSLISSGAALLLSSAAFFVVSPAKAIVAPACDPGCVPGFHCEAQTMRACPEIACAPGTNCTSTCTDTFVYGCVADPCTDDRDCSGNTVCATETSGCAAATMPAPAPCPPGADCKAAPQDPIPPGACEPIVTRMCKPKYELPCNTAADCGEGFTCVAEMACGCSGSAPSSGSGAADPAPSGAPAPLPPGTGGVAAGGGSAGGGTSTGGMVSTGGSTGVLPPPECSCTPSGVSRCQLTLQACNFNSDCPTGLVCKSTTQNDVAPPGIGGASGTAGSGSAGLAGAPNPGGAAEQPAPAPLPQPTELFCVPANWSYPVPSGVGGVSGGETGNPTPDRPNGTGGTTGVGGSTGIGGGTVGTGGTGEAPPTAPGKGTTADHVEGGCQVGSGGSASSGFGILAALGLAGLLRRRNRSAA